MCTLSKYRIWVQSSTLSQIYLSPLYIIWKKNSIIRRNSKGSSCSSNQSKLFLDLYFLFSWLSFLTCVYVLQQIPNLTEHQNCLGTLSQSLSGHVLIILKSQGWGALPEPEFFIQKGISEDCSSGFGLWFLFFTSLEMVTPASQWHFTCFLVSDFSQHGKIRCGKFL